MYPTQSSISRHTYTHDCVHSTVHDYTHIFAHSSLAQCWQNNPEHTIACDIESSVESADTVDSLISASGNHQCGFVPIRRACFCHVSVAHKRGDIYVFRKVPLAACYVTSFNQKHCTLSINFPDCECHVVCVCPVLCHVMSCVSCQCVCVRVCVIMCVCALRATCMS